MFATRSGFFGVLAMCGLLLLAVPAVATAEGKVEGTITLDGKPLEAGKIAFYQDNGQFVGCKFKDGKFKIDRAPTGVVLRVAFDAKGVPPAFASEDTTGLVVQVSEKGPNNFQFALTSQPN
jgi:hypothetical protein